MSSGYHTAAAKNTLPIIFSIDNLFLFPLYSFVLKSRYKIVYKQVTKLVELLTQNNINENCILFQY